MKNTLGRTVGSAFAAWAFGLLSFALLSACGDDNSTGSGSRTSGKETVYADVDDLPECTATNAESLVDVAGDYYTCAAKKWEKVLEVAKGVCNIRPCDKSTEGKWIYAYSAGTAYQCKSGAWKDAAGKTFDELEFVGCFMDALVQDTVESADDLKNCTENKEGDIFVVGKNMVACYSQKWVEVPGGVISEGDLPDCSGNGYIYVMGKMAVYQCKEGSWYGNGKAVTPSKEESSSSTKTATTSSSSGKPASSVAIEDDSTKVRGVCLVSKSAVEKGETVAYSFYNMGGTIVSYTWDFGENASATTSDVSSPEVSFSRGGTHRAKLVLNKGRKSESDEIVCPGVSVEAVPVTGCVCATDAVSLMLKGSRSEAQWSVSGCEGGSPFTYEWGNGASGTEASATGRADATGKYAPTVTVTNTDGGTMEPECKAVPVMETLGAECRFMGNLFQINNVTGLSDEISSIEVTLVSATGVSIEDTLRGPLTSKCTNEPGYGFKCRDAYEWSWVNRTIEINEDLGYARFALVYAGDTLCTVSPVSCEPSASVAHKGETLSWNMHSSSLPQPSPKTVSRIIIDEDGNEHSGPTIVATKYGVIGATMILDEGLSTENVLACPDVSVEPREITDCACGAPELLSDSNDLAAVESVSYRWTIDSCRSEGAEPLTYTWESGYVVDATNETVVTRTFTEKGAYRPVVTVENQEGEVQDFACKAGVVKGGTSSELVYGGQTYRTVLIGSQVWMAENLNYPAEGSVCPLEEDSYCEKYGRLYSAPSSDLCPDGWHIPTSAEWAKLIEFIDENNGTEGVGKSLKAADDWMEEGTVVHTEHGFRTAVAAGIDYFDFSALPAGCCWDGQCYSDDETRFWVSNGEAYKIAYDSDGMELDEDIVYATELKISVRCVKDGEE